MIGLIKKDLYIIIKNLNPIQLLVILVVVIPMSQFPQFILLIISLMVSYMCSIFTSMSFTYDAMSKWEDYLIALPLSTKQIVGAKYLLVIIEIFVTYSTIGITYLICKASNIASLSDLKVACLLSFLFVGTFNAIQIPFIYKFGAEMGRYAMIIMLAVPYGFVGLMSLLHIQIDIRNLGGDLGYSFLMIGQIAILILSFEISVEIYRASKKGGRL